MSLQGSDHAEQTMREILWAADVLERETLPAPDPLATMDWQWHRHLYLWAWHTFKPYDCQYHAPEQYYKWLCLHEQAKRAWQAQERWDTVADEARLSMIYSKLRDNKDGVKRLTFAELVNAIHERESLLQLREDHNRAAGKVRGARSMVKIRAESLLSEIKAECDRAHAIAIDASEKRKSEGIGEAA